MMIGILSPASGDLPSTTLYSSVVRKCLVAVPPILLVNLLGQSLRILWKQLLIFMYLRSQDNYSTTVSGKPSTTQLISHFIAQFAQLLSPIIIALSIPS